MRTEANSKSNRKSLRKTVIIGLVVALIFVVVGSFVLSYSMETLDKQAEELGAQESPIWNPPLPDYSIPGLESAWGSLIVGIMGVVLLFGMSYGVASHLKRKHGS